MENSHFVFSDSLLHIDKFHICAWEFGNYTSLVEFGFEIKAEVINNHESLAIGIYIPWLEPDLIPKDLYNNLKESYNSKFIFNDSIKNIESLDDGANTKGVIQHFLERKPLAILPITFKPQIKNENVLYLNVDLTFLNRKSSNNTPNIYVRFYLEPSLSLVSTRKNGVGKSTIIYDTKVNVLRNLPHHLLNETLCCITSCFSFNIIPNSYDIVFFDSESLQNIRTLEYESFKKYLPDKRVKDKEFLVIFNKKKTKFANDNFNFFVIFKKERIGTGQFALAVLINLLCGVLLSFPSYRKSVPKGETLFQNLPNEFWIAVVTGIATLIYFLSPYLRIMIYQTYKRVFK